MNLKSISRPLYLAWRFKDKFYELSHSNDPWLAQGAIGFCKNHLIAAQVGLEWGSGRSTIWFAEKVQRLISVEHSHLWYEVVTKRLRSRGLNNVDLRYIPLEHDANEPTVAQYQVCPAYVSVVREVP